MSTAARGWTERAPRPAPEATPAERAVLRTVAYAGLFQAPLSLAELHRALMDVSVDLAGLARLLDRPFLRARVAVTRGLVHPIGRADWLELRRRRGERTRALLGRHRRALAGLARFPFVRLVALSGACAHDNAADEDVDVFLVVEEGRAWAVCLAVMALSKLCGLRRSLCVNYVVDESALELQERDVFTASELAGLKPLAGRRAYLRFVAANAWVAERFPNFFAGHRAAAEAVGEVAGPRWLERLLDLGLAPLLEAGSRRWLGRRLARQARGRPGVALSPHRLKLHLFDHRPRLLDAYGAALRELGEPAEARE